MKIAATLREELLSIMGALVIVSPRSFTFAGRPSSGISMPLPGLGLAPEMPPLLNELVGQLYQHCYSSRFTGTLTQPDLPGQALDTEWFERLSSANLSKSRFEDGWHMQFGMPSGQVIAQRGALTRMLAPGEFVDLGGSGMALAPGTVLRLYIASESRTMQPGYYYAFGETLSDSFGEISVVRFYWNVPFESAADLLQLISGGLNLWQVPFRFKVSGIQTIFERSDSAVLYVPRRYAQLAFELVWEAYKQIGPNLRNDVPLFTLRLAPGLAFAEDPGTQESFGMSRCRLLAQGLWLAHLRGVHQADEQLQVIDEQFASEGISLEHPWLNRGSVDEFAFPASVTDKLCGEW
jgi:hypothetical protein